MNREYPTFFTPYPVEPTPEPIARMESEVNQETMQGIEIRFPQQQRGGVVIDLSMGGDESFTLDSDTAETMGKMLLEAAAKLREYNAAHA